MTHRQKAGLLSVFLGVVLICLDVSASVSHPDRFQICRRLRDQNVQYFNGASGDWYNIIREEVETDSNSWQTSAVNLSEVGSYATTDQINVLPADYGATNWAGFANTTHVENCFIDAGEALLNTFYLTSLSR